MEKKANVCNNDVQLTASCELMRHVAGNRITSLFLIR